jgi:hypothetical protein
LTPSLAQVLAQGGAAAHSSINPLFLLAGISVFFLAAFSTAKGIELFRNRRPLLPCLLDETPPLSEIKDNEEDEKLSFLSDQNRHLQGKIQELTGVLTNVKQTRDMLEKSNLVLVKESTKLKSERENLVLNASEPLIAVKAQPITAEVKARLPLEKKAAVRTVKRTEVKIVPLAAANKPKAKLAPKPEAKPVKKTAKIKALKAVRTKKGDRKPKRVSRKLK